MKPKKFHNVLSWGDNEETLKKVQSKFLKYFPKNGRILDLGSGRGTFLTLLKDNGFLGCGVECDDEMYTVSKKRKLEVYKDDVISFLEDTNLNFNGIMVSHLIEHLDTKNAEKLIELIKQKLKPGGVAIIITPRPGSLWACENFWLDTTHVRPYPYALLEKLLYPLKVLAGGIEPDSNPLLSINFVKKLLYKIRKAIIGKELFDFAYGGGVWYIVAKKGTNDD